MQPLTIMHLALGGCLRSEPKYGITEDTGGHITYILGAARALARRSDVARCEIVTRLFDEPALGRVHANESEIVAPKLGITRIDSGNRRYLSKEALAGDREAFTAALIENLRRRTSLPDCIHAHFADAAEVARKVRDALGIPFIYTPHSLAADKAACCETVPSCLEHRLAEEDRAIGQADAIVASSRDECERQVMAYPSAKEETVWRIRPGIDQRVADNADMAAAREAIAPFLRDPSRPIVLAIARPVRKKNLAALVEAFGRHPDLPATANLVILPGLRDSMTGGEAEQAEVMRDIFDAIDRFDLHGIAAYPRQHDASIVRGLYRLAAESGGVFVNPALFEPFGLTILEAAVHGLPVVTTSRGGPSDIVAEIGHGDLVDPTDTDAIGAAIFDLVRDRARHRRYAASAADRIGAVSWDAYAEQFMGAVRSVTGEQASATVQGLARPTHLLVCDIDNTLTGCRNSAAELSAYLRDNPHIAFGIATGRSLVEARRILNDWKLPSPCVWITSVGSEIHWADGGRLRRDEEFARRIASGWDAERVDRLMEPLSQFDPQPCVDQKRFKRSFFCADATEADALRPHLADRGIPARVIFSHGRLLDILPARAGKGAAVRFAAESMRIPEHRVIVAGDSGNDRDMIESCAQSILVSNCEPEMQAVGRRTGAFMARQAHAAGVLEGLRAHLAISNREVAA
ncbi:HAD-IIB family hydrolase [Qipengyuania sp. JC766]|uniref:HAD-IIB family hydrolase n=1 Tax=Qipengyuania sp. JC766 TaxID=3232139 RepID=UPI003459C906